MENSASSAIPEPPRLIATLRAGFDTVANHILLILFPVCLDLLIWLGPHLRLKTLVEGIIQQLMLMPGWATGQSEEVVQASQELWMQAANQFNLLSVLRAYPVGIPSLMAGSLPLDAPGQLPIFREISSPTGVVSFWLLLTLTGLTFGTLFYILVSQAAVIGQVRFPEAMAFWPRASVQIIGLSLLLALFILVLAVPASCLISALSLGGMALGPFAIFLFGGLLLWVLFPLFLAPQGIVASQSNIPAAIRKSLILTRMTLPATSSFFLVILLLSQGFNFLWRVPPETSWLTLVGIAGHAFITTGLLAATFVYYYKADLWTQYLIRQLKLGTSTNRGMTV